MSYKAELLDRVARQMSELRNALNEFFEAPEENRDMILDIAPKVRATYATFVLIDQENRENPDATP